MAHDGFLVSFHGLAWPFDALQLQQVVMGGSGAGWENEASVRALDSALGSLVSSPSSLAAAATGGAHEAVLMEVLASRLGGVCGSLSVPSPPSSRYASCYSKPVCSPSKPAPPVPALLAADAVLTKRAARLSSLPAAGGSSGRKLSRVASSQSLLAEPAAAPGGVHLPGSDGSSSEGHCRKRKAPAAKAKGKDAVATAITKSPEPETRANKCKLSMDANRDGEPIKPAAGEAAHGGNGKGKEAAAEPPKGYIHVRVRRGQATDSHSLAERMRREKISERMKLLQDLVPGCSKVTGKAVMLDEIINYVQSLQRQVEFLSMKLATVNPRPDFDVDNFIPKDSNQPTAPAPSSLPLPLPPPAYSLEGSSSAFCYASSQVSALQSVVTDAKGLEMPPSFANHGIPCSSLDGFHSANSQIGGMWEDDLHSVFQMGFRGNT